MFGQTQIAVVDDDASFRDSLRRLLAALDCVVAEFPSAAEFLASPKFPATACLIADVHMPVMTGIDLYQHLVERGLAVPTILVTAYPDGAVRRRMLEMGVNCYLAKPLEEALLIECLRSALARGAATRGAG